jgi:hypothetical protein
MSAITANVVTKNKQIPQNTKHHKNVTTLEFQDLAKMVRASH